MSKAREKIESILYSQGTGGKSPLETALFLASLAYGRAVKLRSAGYSKKIIKAGRLPCIVISIGNLSVGGTGKTPMAIHMAGIVKSLGYSAVVISRGYKGLAGKNTGLVSDGRTIFMSPQMAGDEPLLLAKRLDIPVIVGRDRFQAGRAAMDKFNPQVIILDDGFQHLALERDLDLVLLDHQRPFGNLFLLPRGILRESPSALSRADAIVFTRSDNDFVGDSLSVEKLLPENKPIFKTIHKPSLMGMVRAHGNRLDAETGTEKIKSRKIFAFSGIAGNLDFLKAVKNIPCKISDFIGFPDHHFYRDNDLDMIRQQAAMAEADALITTEKDFARMGPDNPWPLDLFVLGVDISFPKDGPGFHKFIKNHLSSVIMKRKGSLE